MRDSFLIFGEPLIEQEDIEEVVATLKSGWIGTGPKVAAFEEAFAKYKGLTADHAAAVNSCTAALHLSMLAAGIAPGDEVITTPLTFCATVNAIIHAGGIPKLVDIDTHTLNIDPELLESSITPRTRAILPVHFAGRPCEMDSISNIANKHNLVVIEDCAHSIESEYKGQKIGTIGDFGCFSFYVTKNVVTGEGGMVLARNKKLIDKVRILALHGMSRDAWKRFSDSGYKHYEVVNSGFKYNMMDLQAALGVHQLARIERNWQKRKSIWNRYQEAFSGLPVGRPAEPDTNTRHAYHLYTLVIDKDKCRVSRDDFINAMTSMNIGVGVHYQTISDHEFYHSEYSLDPEDTPVATRIGRSIVSLPLSAKLGDKDVNDVIEATNKIINQ